MGSNLYMDVDWTDRISMGTSTTYSIVVPCYCSGDWLPELVNRISSVMTEIGDKYEIILVDDASPDSKTWSEIEGISRENAMVRGFRLMSNVGQYRSTLAGFSKCEGKFVITIDDDLQHLPEDIPILINEIRGDPNVDCIIGSFSEKKHSKFRNLGTSLIGAIFTKFYDKPRDLRVTAFRIMRSDLAKAALSHKSNKPNLMAVLLQQSKRVRNVEVSHEDRPYGSSGYRIKDLIGFTMDNVFAITNAPLRLLSISGFLASIGSLILMSYYFLLWQSGGIAVPGFTTQVLLITFFGGATLFSVGLLGEYVSRIVTEVSGSEKFFIRDEIGTQIEVEKNGGNE